MITVEMATLGDIPLIMSVMKAAFLPQFGEAWTETQCSGALSMPGAYLAIARSQEEVAGFALWREVIDEAELYLIATEPKHAKRGVATELMEYCFAAARERRVQVLLVEVRCDNPAIDFYRSRGFVQIGSRTNYYRRIDGGPTDALTLRRTLLT